MKWYHFGQNNSGGRWDGTQDVYVEAPDAETANALAQTARVGLYFDGCGAGRDCGGCGDRWSEVLSDEGTDEPMCYTTPAREPYSEWGGLRTWAIYHLDGRTETSEDV